MRCRDSYHVDSCSVRFEKALPILASELADLSGVQEQTGFGFTSASDYQRCILHNLPATNSVSTRLVQRSSSLAAI